MQPEMTFDYGSETPAPLYTSPSFLLSCIGLRSGRVKLFNFRARLSDLSQRAEAIPQHRPKQHVVCLHHFDRPMKLNRSVGRPQPTGELGKGRCCLLTSRCADHASSGEG